MSKKKQNPEVPVDAQEQIPEVVPAPELVPEVSPLSEKLMQISDSLAVPEATPQVTEKAIPRFF